MSFDQVLLMGRIGNEVELRQTPNKKSVINLNVAINKYNESTVWNKCVGWGKNAENIARFFKKGDGIVLVCGVEDPETWIDNSGEARATNLFTINSWTFPVGGQNQEEAKPKAKSSKNGKKNPKEEELDLDAILAEDEIPF